MHDCSQLVVYMYNCTCMYDCSHIYVQLYMHDCSHVHVHVCTCMYDCSHVHVHVHACMCDCSHIKFHWCMHARATVQSQYRRKKLTCTAITCDFSFEKEDFPEK